jgi:hypothetical protein
LYQGWTPNRKLPLATKPLINAQNLHPSKLPTFVELTNEQTVLLGQVEMTNKMQTDDIPGTQRLFAKQWVDELRKLNIVWHKKDVFDSLATSTKSPIPWDQPLLSQDYSPRDIFHPTYDSFNQVLRMHGLLRQVERFDKTFRLPPLLDVLAQYYPVAVDRIRHFENNGWHRTDAINLALGGVPAEPSISIHPILSRYIKKGLLTSGLLYLRGRTHIGNFLSTMGKQFENNVRRSTINRMYCY